MSLTGGLLLAQVQGQTTTPVTHLSGGDKIASIGLVFLFVLLSGVVVIVGRNVLEGAEQSRRRSRAGPPDTTLIRSWLAIALVGSLLLFVAISFWIDDTTLRSTLVGGVVASAGAAVAFYFASKTSDQARRDILNAALPGMLVPDLIGKDLTEVRELLAATPFRLDTRPATPKDGAQVIAQDPGAHQPATPGSAVVTMFAGPVPALTGMTPGHARDALGAAGLELVAVPDKPADDAKVASQDPTAAAPVPGDARVTATFAAPATPSVPVVPDLTGMTLDAATAELAEAGLQIVADPAKPAARATVRTQIPPAGSPLPADRTVTAMFS